MTYEVEVHIQAADDPDGPRQVLKSEVVVSDEEREAIGLDDPDALENEVHRQIEEEARSRVDLEEGEIIRSLYVRQSQEDS